MLFVPSNVPRYIERAHERGADTIILDLEDSVPESEKAAARPVLRGAYKSVSQSGADVLVRINKPFEQRVLDLDAAIAPGIDGILFPKLETARELAILDALIHERELAAGLTPGSVGVLCAIESARGVLNINEIVAECERVERVFGISYGAEDATEELGVETTLEGWERFYGNALSVQAAAAAGIQAYGRLGSAFDFRDLTEYEASAVRSAQFGFKGASCIHPAQVPVLNRAFSPSAEQVERARKTIELMQEALRAGRASASLDGRMIDTPTLRRAERILERQAAIQEKEARKLTSR
jgi:citrate lyase subunit beta/citryl-CoA lyase